MLDDYSLVYLFFFLLLFARFDIQLDAFEYWGWCENSKHRFNRNEWKRVLHFKHKYLFE